VLDVLIRGGHVIERGSRVKLRQLAEEAHLFRPDTGERISA
jgi:hypothetical protein